MGKGLGLTLVIVGGVVYLTKDYWGKAQAVKRLDVGLSKVDIDHKKTNLTNTVLNVNVSLYNPTDNPLRFEKFQGNVYLNNKRVTDIDPIPYTTIIVLKPRQETIIPLSIKLKNSMLAIDIFSRIIDALRNKTEIKFDGTVRVVGLVKAEGLSIPFDLDYDLKTLV
jgi:LEA14-like dessication related protein